MQDLRSNELVAHFFRKEYGKILAVISRYVNIDDAEDIVQDTLATATENWKLNGIPPNPEAWLYKTAKNKALNFLRKQKSLRRYPEIDPVATREEIEFSDQQISDDLLRVMLECCQTPLSSDIRITLILKVLCGFSIFEIASAFYTSEETINKRLVRGRKKLRKSSSRPVSHADLNNNIETLLTVIYLLFNEGYLPASKSQILRKDFCWEAIRLAEIIAENRNITNTGNAHALLALMYLNCSRFEARMDHEEEMIEIEYQDRTLWDKDLINKGLHHLDMARQRGHLSKFLILASISGNHCVARTWQETNWDEILFLYDALLTLEDSPVVRLNRVVALSRAKGTAKAISELEKLENLDQNHLYHAVFARFQEESGETSEAISCYRKAIDLSRNPRDTKFLSKKLNELVPVSSPDV